MRMTLFVTLCAFLLAGMMGCADRSAPANPSAKTDGKTDSKTDTKKDAKTDGKTDGNPNNKESPTERFDAKSFENPTHIDNSWFPLTPGTRFVWDGTSVDEEGDVEAHSVVFVVTDMVKEIDGVKAVVCWDRDYVDGELEEAEIVFFAQDTAGNVWHFGQYPEEYSDGEVAAAPGWLHGVNGQAGIHMPANPKLGDPSFSQGWAPSVPWTDRSVVHKTGLKVKVSYGEFEDVLVMDEYNQEEPDAHQLKFYARGVGNIKVGVLGTDEAMEQLELIKVEKLTPEEMEQARQAVLKLEQSANEHCKEVFAKSKPSAPAS